jgi:methionine synthase I (cobalamin-dependent)
MTNLLERQEALKDSLEQRVLVLDGAMGTMIHAAPLLIETDYLGRDLPGEQHHPGASARVVKPARTIRGRGKP